MAVMGRPTKYTDDCIAKAKDYLESWPESGDVIPTQAGLAVVLKLSIECVEKWGRDESKVEFLRVLAEIKVKQRNILINRGLTGDFNSAITKLILSKHGFSDTQLIGSDPNNPLTFKTSEADIDARIAAIISTKPGKKKKYKKRKTRVGRKLV